jgi:hypothetical protein
LVTAVALDGFLLDLSALDDVAIDIEGAEPRPAFTYKKSTAPE